MSTSTVEEIAAMARHMQVPEIIAIEMGECLNSANSFLYHIVFEAFI
jgi:hypothetical protein